MKIFGHPVHIMLIHFPSAFFPMDLACSLIYHYSMIASFGDASFYAMSGGVILGWLAFFFGCMDLVNIFEKQAAAMKTALIHGGINTMVLIVYTLLAWKQFNHYPTLSPDGMPVLVLKAATIGFMIAGNFMGGNLILRHKVAVEKD